MQILIALIVSIAAGLIVWWFTEGRRRRQIAQAERAGKLVAGALPSADIPNNLPGRAYFVGRSPKIGEVLSALASRQRLVIIDGIGGIGKTALALEVGHICLENSRNAAGLDIRKPTLASDDEVRAFDALQFLPDAIVWFTARDHPATLEELFDTVGKTLGYEFLIGLPLDLKREGVFRLLRSHHCLLIIDNFDTITDARIRDFISILPEPTATLITSRWKNVESALSVSLSGLAPADALLLIRNEAHRLGIQELQALSDAKIAPLVEATGAAPLAIKWAIGQMKQRGQSFARVLDRIRNAEADIFEDMFARSWELLSQRARHILLALATFRTSVSAETLRLAMDATSSEFEEAVGQLIEMSLVEAYWLPANDITMYSIIYLTRMFASDIIRKNPELGLRSRNAVILWARYEIRTHGDSSWEAYDWNWERYSFLDADLENLFGALDLSLEAEAWKDLLEMVMGLMHYFGVRGLLNERISRSQQGLQAARRIGDAAAQAWLYVAGFGWTYIQQGLFDSGFAVVEEGRKIAEEMDLKPCIAEAYRHLGVIALEQDNYAGAQQYLSKALAAAAIPRIQARIHDDLGRLAERTREYERAMTEYRTSLDISLQCNDYWGKLVTPLYLAELEFMKKDYSGARKDYEQALNLAEGVRAHWVIAEAQFGLARIESEQRRFSRARDLLETTIRAFDKLGMPDRKARAVELLRGLP